MSNIETAKELLAWNTANLNAAAIWTTENLAKFFPPTFMVYANGRRYEANYTNYAEFLNHFRANLKSIKYDCHEFIINDEYVIIPLMASLTYNNASEEKHEAILILKFNSSGQIIVWREVYTKQEMHT